MLEFNSFLGWLQLAAIGAVVVFFIGQAANDADERDAEISRCVETGLLDTGERDFVPFDGDLAAVADQ